MNFFLSTLISFIIGLVSATIISKVGFKLGLADIPNKRSAHHIPIPKGGGIGIPIAAVIVSLFINKVYILIGLAFILSVVALINDRKELPVSLRLILEFTLSIAIVLVYKKKVLIYIYNNYSLLVVIALAILISIFIVATTNFFNFMDGINGIAGFEAIITFVFLGLFALYLKKSPEIAIITFAVSSASAGFLLLNFPKAKVFMGDVGSVFIGFLFTGTVIYLVSNIKEFLLLTLFLSIFYIDTSSTILIRLLNKKNILKAHKDHLYQKLVHNSGWTHAKVTIYFGIAQTFIGFFGLILFRFDILFLIIFWVIIIMFYWGILISSNLLKPKISIKNRAEL